MRITPLSIKRQEFRKVVRGYDPDEVNTFLEIIANEFDELIKKNDELSASVNQMTKKLQDYQQIEKGLQQTLLTAQEASSRSMEVSKRQAVLMIKEAEIKAKSIVDKAKAEAKELQASLIELKNQKQTLIARLKAILTAQAQLLDILSKGETGIQKEEVKANTDIEQIVDRLI